MNATILIYVIKALKHTTSHAQCLHQNLIKILPQQKQNDSKKNLDAKSTKIIEKIELASAEPKLGGQI